MREDTAPRLLAVAHGTASVTGSRTTAELADALRAERPDVRVDLCFLDVATPTLAESLNAQSLTAVPTIVVPVLLSTGYHVQTDIPAAVIGMPHVSVSRHLGPHPLLIDALIDRRPDVADAASTVLIGAGSSRPEAAGEMAAAADMLAARLGRAVRALTVDTDLRATLAALPAPIAAATYLLADGQFVTALRSALGDRGTAGDPIGVHPALVELIWTRYDEARAQVR